jgi:CrcB protein
MLNVLFIGIGGFFGAISRYLASFLLQKLAGESEFPLGIMCVNIIGCLVIGFLGGMSDSYNLFSQEARALIFTGFLGAFTTFSTFSYDALNLLRHNQILFAVIYVGGSVLIGLACAWLGYNLAYLKLGGS